MVVGIDRLFSYPKLLAAQQAILHGGHFIATNRDATFPMEVGEIPGGGSLVAALATAAGREPITIGKPETHAYEEILKAAGVSAEDHKPDVPLMNIPHQRFLQRRFYVSVFSERGVEASRFAIAQQRARIRLQERLQPLNALLAQRRLRCLRLCRHDDGDGRQFLLFCRRDDVD